MQYVIAILIGYLLGSSNMAYWISKYKKVDIRSNGTGNLGASNATVLLGWGAGVIVAVHDIGKAFLSVLLAKALFYGVENVGVAAGVACVLGHIYPFYLNFKGGKGLASLIGVVAALDWRVALACGAGGGGTAGSGNAGNGLHCSGYDLRICGLSHRYVADHP